MIHICVFVGICFEFVFVFVFIFVYLLLYQCHHDVYNECGREAEMNKHKGGRWAMLHARQLPVCVKQLLDVEELCEATARCDLR